MPVKQRQIIETADEDDEPTVSEADAERIIDEIMIKGTRLRQKGKGNEILLSLFTHPIEKCWAWAVEVWLGYDKWVHVYFTPKQADEFYYKELDRLELNR